MRSTGTGSRKSSPRSRDGLRETNLRLEKMALLDPLTELYNRRGLQQALKRETQILSREGGPLMVLIFSTSMTLKRSTIPWAIRSGISCSKRPRKKIQDSVRASDHVARIGGDEFILLLPKNPSQRRASSRGTASVRDIEHHDHRFGKETLRITASFGLTSRSKSCNFRR
jgi:diguanylate cyclase (GGDEF)-like protein